MSFWAKRSFAGMLPTRPSSRCTPLYADVGDLGAVTSIGGRERIAIEVAPLTPELPIWAFIRVVHNET